MTIHAAAETVVITGASAGIGRATVRRFAAAGYNVGLIARGEDGLRAAAQEVRSQGGRALPMTCDVSDSDAVENAASRVEDELGPVDVWVNDAMVSVFSPVSKMKAEEYKRVTKVSYLGPPTRSIVPLIIDAAKSGWRVRPSSQLWGKKTRRVSRIIIWQNTALTHNKLPSHKIRSSRTIYGRPSMPTVVVTSAPAVVSLTAPRTPARCSQRSKRCQADTC